MMKACSEFSIRKASFVSYPLESGFRPFSASMKNSELLVLGNRMIPARCIREGEVTASSLRDHTV